MSYTNETTHYGIPLPLGTDKTTPMDYNESMQEVDTVLFGAKSDSDSALRKAQQVETGLSQTDETVSGIAGRVTTLEGTSVTHGNAIQQNAHDIADVRADALDMIEAKDEGTAQVATVAVNKGEYFRYNDVLYIATQNIAVNDTIVPNTNCRATNVGTELNQLNNDLASKVDTSKLSWVQLMYTQPVSDNTVYSIEDISGLNEISITFIMEPTTNVFRKATMHLIVSDIIYGDTDQYILNMYEKSMGTVYSASVQFYFIDATHLYVQALTFEGWSSAVDYIRIKGR